MAVLKAKPTSPGRRFVVKIVNPELHKGKPHKGLLDSKSGSGGRNNAGRITTRHRGGGHKRRIRVVDFKRNKDGVPAIVERLEYDPNRTANIALLKYADGERRYIIAPRGVRAGDPIMSGGSAPIRPGNAMSLRNVPVGSVVHCVELKTRQGRADCAQRGLLGAVGRSGRGLRNTKAQVRRNAAHSCRLPCHLGRSGQQRAQPAFPRQGRG